MRASGSGPFGVLLLAAPLIAVPLLAIFGIPQFAPGLDASSTLDQMETGLEDEQLSPRTSRNRKKSPDDLFQPVGNTSADELSDAEIQSEKLTDDDWSPPAEALQGFRMAPPEEQFAEASESEEWLEQSRELEQPEKDDRSSAEFDQLESRRDKKNKDRENEGEVFDRQVGDPPQRKQKRRIDPDEAGLPQELQTEASFIGRTDFESPSNSGNRSRDDSGSTEQTESFVAEEEFSWRKASRRLHDLGENIKHYFDYDIEKEVFIFHCRLSPLDDPGVVQEFEAQGQEPLVTVYDVIKQVEKWSKNRQSSLARSEQKGSAGRSR